MTSAFTTNLDAFQARVLADALTTNDLAVLYQALGEAIPLLQGPGTGGPGEQPPGDNSAASAAWLAPLYSIGLGIGGGTLPAQTNTIRIAIALATVSSVTDLPAGAVVTRSYVDVTTAYSAGATIALTVGATSIQPASDVLPQQAALYDEPQDTAIAGGGAPLTVTITGAPSAGAGFVYVEYSVPSV